VKGKQNGDYTALPFLAFCRVLACFEAELELGLHSPFTKTEKNTQV
jgi:hypothetical protein